MKVQLTDGINDHEIFNVSPQDALGYMLLCKAVDVNLSNGKTDDPTTFLHAEFDGDCLWITFTAAEEE